MITTYTFQGKAAWLKRDASFTDAATGKKTWTMNFYPANADIRKSIKATGIKNKPQEDDGEKSGLEGMFYTFRSNEPYAITDAKGNDLQDAVSNGADVVVELQVETFTSKVHGPQARSKLVRVLVNNYTPYVKPEAPAAQPELPA